MSPSIIQSTCFQRSYAILKRFPRLGFKGHDWFFLIVPFLMTLFWTLQIYPFLSKCLYLRQMLICIQCLAILLYFSGLMTHQWKVTFNKESDHPKRSQHECADKSTIIQYLVYQDKSVQEKENKQKKKEDSTKTGTSSLQLCEPSITMTNAHFGELFLD